MDLDQVINSTETCPPADPPEAAKAVGLRYVCDDRPGFRRRPAGKGFVFLDPQGGILRDSAQLDRIRSLAIPPAWTRVWICPLAEGHLQATGVDARGRKQYRYHPRWREVRDETKYTRLLSFARALPGIRTRVAKDLNRPRLSRPQVMATVVKLLEVSLIRVGNKEYARQNGSYGLTTMRDRHVEVQGSTVNFRFRGKSGKDHDIQIEDPRLARIVQHCQDLPGQELFQYLDNQGDRQAVTSEDVNEYIRHITRSDFTAKDFRTWAGTVLAAEALAEIGLGRTKTEIKKNLNRAVQMVSERLGNTPAICRKCYIHPAVMEAYQEGRTIELTPAKARRNGQATSDEGLRPEEEAVVRLLLERMENATSAGIRQKKPGITPRRQRR